MVNLRRAIYIIVLLFVYLSCGNSHINANKSILNYPLGMNAHLVFDCSKQYMEELCKGMSECGVKIVRLDVYWHTKDMLFQKELLDKAVYYVDKYGMEIELNIPQTPINLNVKELQEWVNMIKYYSHRYDGKHPIFAEGCNSPRYVKIKYFEIMNEMDLKYENHENSVKKAFSLIKMSSNAVRESRPDNSAMVVMPGMCRRNTFSRRLLSYKDSQNKGIKDYVDIMSFHLYAADTGEFYSTLLDWLSFFSEFKEIKGMPIWMSEFGNSTWMYTHDIQSSNLPRQALIALSMGVEKVFYYQFHQPGGNELKEHPQFEDYHGIIDTSIRNSYGAFLENDSFSSTAISEGDATKKIYIRSNSKDFALRSITKKMLEKIKNTGLAIGGCGYTIHKVQIKKNTGELITIYDGLYVIAHSNENILTLQADLFASLEDTDEIVVYVENVEDQSDEWAGLKPLPAYDSFKFLAKMLGNHPGKPTLEKKENEYKVSWIRGKDKVCAIWKESDKILRSDIITLGKEIRYDMYGSKQVAKRLKEKANSDLLYVVTKNN